MATPPLVTRLPTTIAEARINIDHPQLRDLITCPQERGIVIYTRPGEIIEQNIHVPGAPIRSLADLRFEPSSVTALAVGTNDQDKLVAAGGSWNADLHLSYHSPSSTDPLWRFDGKLRGTLNNSVLLTRSSSSSAEPRVGVTNNDGTFRLYDCAVRKPAAPSDEIGDDLDQLHKVGGLRLDTCVNNASLSPSGRTLLTVGDSPNLFLHHLSGSSEITFHPIAKLPVPLPTNTPPNYPPFHPSTFTASFATDFSHDGSKYVVGSQEGVVAVFDMRSTRPMKVWQVDKMRGSVPGVGGATGWVSWDPSDWFHMNAPSWSVRNVKFAGGRDGGKEMLAFTEHTSLVHLIDARTFETEEIIRVPARIRQPPDVPMSVPILPVPPLPQPQASTSQLVTPQRQQSSQEDDDWEMNDEEAEDEDEPEASDLPPLPIVLPVPPNPALSTTLASPLPEPEPEFDYLEDLDIAGVCYDPSGRWLYVGTGEGVVEWGINS